MEQLSGARYTGLEGLDSVTLADGQWRGKPYVDGGAAAPSVWLSPRFYLAGDLDGDGAKEAVVHLAQSGGGTGSYGYLAVMGRESGGLVQKGLAELGDRVQIRAARLGENSIELDVLQAGPEDGMCCPSQLATRVFTMKDGQFTETASTHAGTLSLETLEGITWVLRDAEPTENAPPVTLVFDAGKVSGSAGCNRFNGSVGGGITASSIEIGPLMTTRMTCPGPIMEREKSFLAQLESSEVFSFLTGDLVLNGSQGRLSFSRNHE
jgi:heat shock protein HslJ